MGKHQGNQFHKTQEDDNCVDKTEGEEGLNFPCACTLRLVRIRAFLSLAVDKYMRQVSSFSRFNVAERAFSNNFVGSISHEGRCRRM